MASAKPITKINRMAPAVVGSTIVADAAITFTNNADWVATFGGSPPSFTSVNVSSTIPTSGTDFSMFPGGVAPTSGYYLVMTPTGLWYFCGGLGWTAWRIADARLFS